MKRMLWLPMCSRTNPLAAQTVDLPFASSKRGAENSNPRGWAASQFGLGAGGESHLDGGVKGELAMVVKASSYMKCRHVKFR